MFQFFCWVAELQLSESVPNSVFFFLISLYISSLFILMSMLVAKSSFSCSCCSCCSWNTLLFWFCSSSIFQSASAFYSCCCSSWAAFTRSSTALACSRRWSVDGSVLFLWISILKCFFIKSHVANGCTGRLSKSLHTSFRSDYNSNDSNAYRMISTSITGSPSAAKVSIADCSFL